MSRVSLLEPEPPSAAAAPVVHGASRRAPRRAVVIGAAAAIIVAIGAGVAMTRWSSSHPGHAGYGAGAAAAAGPSRKQREAATLEYPASIGTLPSTITSQYLADKDRTRMTLSLTGLSVSAPGAYRVSAPELRLVSQFHGTSRSPDSGESVIDGTFSLATATPGALAVSRPVGTFIADGEAIDLRPAAKDKSPYTARKQDGATLERLSFKLDTREFLKLARARSASAQFGAVSVQLTPAQLADVREFAARLNPRP